MSTAHRSDALLRRMTAAALREQDARDKQVTEHLTHHLAEPDRTCVYCTYRRRAS